MQMGDVAAAQSLSKALEIQPTLPEAHFGMATLYRMQGKTTRPLPKSRFSWAGPPAQDPRARSEAERMLKELQGE